MTNRCDEIQENIAWGRSLTEAEQAHILSCASCNEAAIQFTQLDAAIKAQMDVSVPDHFADQVMSRIHNASETQKDWATSFSERFLFLIHLRPVQLGLVSAGVLIGLANLIRFVFAVVLPVSA